MALAAGQTFFGQNFNFRHKIAHFTKSHKNDTMTEYIINGV